MIRINLASKKQAPTVAGGKTRVGFSGLKLDSELLKDLPIKRMLLPIVVALLADWVAGDYKKEEYAKADLQYRRAESEKTKLSMEVAKTAGYEKIKLQLEADEKALQIKLQTIQKLINERDTTYRLVRSLAEDIPSDLWLTQFKLEPKGAVFTGQSLSFNSISDFMRKMNQNRFFANLKLASTEQVFSEAGAKIANFQLQASLKGK